MYMREVVTRDGKSRPPLAFWEKQITYAHSIEYNVADVLNKETEMK